MKRLQFCLVTLLLLSMSAMLGCRDTVITQTNDPPAVTFWLPEPDTVQLFGEVWEIKVKVDDPDDDPTTIKVSISSDRDSGIVTDGEPGGDGVFTHFTDTLTPGRHILTARAVDPEGGAGEATMEITVADPGAVPVVTITQPTQGLDLPNFPNFDLDETIFFEGFVEDDSDLPEQMTCTWRADRVTDNGGVLFEGPCGVDGFTSLVYDLLPEGDNRITLVVTDTDDLSGSASVDLVLHDAGLFDHDGDCFCEGDGDPDEDCTGSVDDSCLSILEGDCMDDQITVNPAADEICDGFDTDCDGFMPPEETDDIDADGVVACLDCDDNDGLRFPGNVEVCDDIDNDCNANTADGTQEPWFNLTCGTAVGECTEGFYTCNNGAQSCFGSVEPVDEDALATVALRCDGLDNDCDGATDEDRVDGDGDGADECEDCDDAAPLQNLIDLDADGYSSCAGDCNDLDPAFNPGVAELCDGFDNNCDGFADAADEPGFNPAAVIIQGEAEIDDDGDLLSECEGDCDDTDAAIQPRDADGDGISACAGDCNDLDANSYPGAAEICDGLDNDCNGSDDFLGFAGSETDNDGDGFSECQADCDDLNANRYQTNVEQCDGIDNDCNGLDDAGAPGVGGRESDDDADGFSECEGDCDDTNPMVRNGTPEVCDGLDNDCNGLLDAGDPGNPGQEVDNDGDGQWPCTGDCDDANAANYSGNTEICDGQDNDCNGQDDFGGFNGSETDNDGDILSECNGDCDDSNASIFAGAPDPCNGIDEDCDGSPDNDPIASMCPNPPNVQSTVCNGAGGCAINQCVGGFYNTDGVYSTGCNCGDDSNPGACGSAVSLGSVSGGGLVVSPIGVAPVGGTSDWYVVDFPPVGGARPGGGTPRVLMTRNDGGVYRMDVHYSCAGGAVCGDAQEWSFVDNADPNGGWNTNNTAWPGRIFVRVKRADGASGCQQYQLTITR